MNDTQPGDRRPGQPALTPAEAAALTAMLPAARTQAIPGRQIADAMRQDLPPLRRPHPDRHASPPGTHHVFGHGDSRLFILETLNDPRQPRRRGRRQVRRTAGPAAQPGRPPAPPRPPRPVHHADPAHPASRRRPSAAPSASPRARPTRRRENSWTVLDHDREKPGRMATPARPFRTRHTAP